jgi:uncharacterized protein YndB with AHSA1/START domain
MVSIMSAKEQTGQELEIRKTIVIDASPEVIFKAITDPEELTQWFPDQAILEAKVGGKMKFSFHKNSKGGEPGSMPRQGLFPRRDYH